MAEKKINGRDFVVEPMLATQAMLLQARLIKAVGPALSRLGDVMAGYGKDKSEADKDAANAAAMSALADVFSKANPVEVAGLIRDVVEIAHIRSPSGAVDHVDMDGDMTGHLQDVMPLVVFVLREQFADFFAATPGLGNPGSLLQA
jgi:hypothetical protein